ncbi:uncharacterized protein LOC126922927 [Bombus affinis]|uniref:uncharacterized protein LOC126922927 n=1 Tax=Bombus affinis TaxID=309941 RepID=UPI0021B6FD76|nr:uncharacterized protein LOC126922927 [Bombus affinis]
MSKDTKFFARPKVRFCQSDTGKSITKELKSLTDQNGIKDKPKILSVVRLDKPVKLVKSNEISGNQENKNSKLVDNASNFTLHANASPCSIETSSSLDKNTIKTENQNPLNDANNSQNIKANIKEANIPKISIKLPNNDITVSTDSPIAQSKSLDKTLKSKNSDKINGSKKDYTKGRREKENKSTVVKKNIKTVTTKSTDLDILKHKNRLSSAGTGTKKLNVTQKTSSSITIKKNLNSKLRDIMPCYKYSKVVRDIIGPKIQPYIGPGVSHSQPDDLAILETDENIHTKPIISGEKLAKPEYNSIMCTINKLNEMKKQKVITNIEHLPASYKNLINGKVSTALDFPLDEAVYKDLVDLSIDENQLPSRLTRSKDPEPRQKDVVPILSDFFTPVSTEEYCTSVSIKPRIPETVDSWNAFRISDQISEWKHILNHV